jgi:hypothetical protein
VYSRFFFTEKSAKKLRNNGTGKQILKVANLKGDFLILLLSV